MKAKIHEMIKIGMEAVMEYVLDNGKIHVTRKVRVVGEDELFYYVDTGYLKNNPLSKESIVSFEPLNRS